MEKEIKKVTIKLGPIIWVTRRGKHGGLECYPMKTSDLVRKMKKDPKDPSEKNSTPEK